MTCGTLEIEILNAMWTLQGIDEDMNISVGDVVDFLERNGCDRAYTTIKTVMDRLNSKDVLLRYKAGKKFYYRTTMEKDEMAQESLDKVCRNFFESNPVHMLRFLEQKCENLLAVTRS